MVVSVTLTIYQCPIIPDETLPAGTWKWGGNFTPSVWAATDIYLELQQLPRPVELPSAHRLEKLIEECRKVYEGTRSRLVAESGAVFVCQNVDCGLPFDPIRTRYLCPHCKTKNTCCE